MTRVAIVRVLHTRDLKELLHGEAVRLSLMGFEVEDSLPGADPAGELNIQITLCPDLLKVLRPILAGGPKPPGGITQDCHTWRSDRDGQEGREG